LKIPTIVFFSAAMLFGNFTAALGQAAKADSITARRNYWGSIGLGPTTLGEGMITADVGAEMSNHWVISAEAKGETSLLLRSSPPPSYIDVTTYNILTGKIFKQSSSFITVLAGAGLANVDKNNNPDYSPGPASRQNRYTLNVPVEVQMYFVPATGFAVSIGAYVNLNNIKTTAGISGKLAFGRMSTHNKRRPPHPPWLPGPKN
jgi:hypothetical protein